MDYKLLIKIADEIFWSMLAAFIIGSSFGALAMFWYLTA